MMYQPDLPFDDPLGPGEILQLLTPREIWLRLNQALMTRLGESRRVEYKRGERVDFEDFATYLSTFSNTLDGGVIVFGANSKGQATGCSKLAEKTLNEIERCHLNMCPLAKPETKRIKVVVNGKEDFCVAIYIPYVGRLVETHANEAWVRYGDSRHKMSEAEKQDFRSTRHELAYELTPTSYIYPDDFDMDIVGDFCLRFRDSFARQDWSDEEILADRHLGEMKRDVFVPFVNLVLLAAKDSAKTIPGSRIRIQRFSGEFEGSGVNYNPIRDRYIEGNVVKLIRDATEEINDFMYDVTWLGKDGRFVTNKEYPRLAWIECIVNACVHRSYNFSGTEITVKFFSDRLEVESPGGFVPPVTEETIYVTRAARNHHLMDALRHLGYVRMAREGTQRIRAGMQEWGLPEPLFKQEALHGVVVRVTLKNDYEFRKRSTDRDVANFFGVEVWKALQEHEIKIVGSAFHNGTIQVSEAQRLTGRTWGTSKKDLERLARKGILEFIQGEYVRDPKAHYRLKPKEVAR